jgi:prolyl-tRNA editing enzyme YbaK/EbsC (Cys-tRNA(Pro) deacylase)
MHSRAEEFVDRARERYGFEPAVEEFPAGTRTAEAAAEAIGCPVGAIASSLVVGLSGDPTSDGDKDGAAQSTRLVVAVTSGANRLDTDRVAAYFDAPAADLADAESVREATGWAIGGVPPFAHETTLPVVFDPALAAYDPVWAAAGTPEAVFPAAPERLRRLADADVVDLTERDG